MHFDFLRDAGHAFYPAGGALGREFLGEGLDMAGERHHAAANADADMFGFHRRIEFKLVDHALLQFQFL